MIQFDREKYIRIMRSEGVNAALTALHLDTERLELETFEGEKGYQPEMWNDLNQIRDFSRELWKIALDEGHKPQTLSRNFFGSHKTLAFKLARCFDDFQLNSAHFRSPYFYSKEIFKFRSYTRF